MLNFESHHEKYLATLEFLTVECIICFTLYLLYVYWSILFKPPGTSTASIIL